MLDIEYDDFSGKGLHDSGADGSAITLSALKKVKNYKYVPLGSRYNTTSGSGIILGVTLLNLTILNITKPVVLFVIDPPNFRFDFIIGTDYIPEFRLNLDYNLKVTQSEDLNINATLLSPSIWNDYMSYELFNDKVNHLDEEKKIYFGFCYS